MTGSLVDLSTPSFWFVVSGGSVALTPVVWANLRRWLWALVNVAFLWLILGPSLLAVAAGVVLFYLLLQALTAEKSHYVTLVVLASAIGLFVVHKLPWIGERLHCPGVHPILVSIGYSYVFLRLIDVARATWERRHPPPALVDLVNYLLPFHMLAAGPIQAWDDFVAQPAIPAPLSATQALSMVERIVHGLFKKYVLAFIVLKVFLTQGRATGWYSLVEMNMAYVWLYLDFSAYSDIAVGIGGLLGVATPENFRRPYLARNVTDFWERWHISLSQWIRRNLFFPIQLSLVRRTGGKHALWCASIAIFIAFVLCGVWHGLNLPFLLWGLTNALGLIAVNLYRHWLKKRLGGKGVARYLSSVPIRIVAVVLTFEFIAFSVKLVADR
jgi:D-alanyl-lipoteichoic acid acyltransferase DltB (MBOAT superfamily)